MFTAVALLIVGCGSGSGQSAAKTGSTAKPAAGSVGDATNGKNLFASKGCIACHAASGVPGATGTIGPSLNGLGDQAKRAKLADGEDNSAENIKGWIKDPGKKKPGTMMPNLNLTDKEADDLTAFLQTLR